MLTLRLNLAFADVYIGLLFIFMKSYNQQVYWLAMHSKRSGQGDGSVSMPVRTSDRLRRRPKGYGRPYMYYTPTIMRPKRSKTKTRTAASQIAKMLRPGNRPVQTSNTNVCALVFLFFFFFSFLFCLLSSSFCIIVSKGLIS